MKNGSVKESAKYIGVGPEYNDTVSRNLEYVSRAQAAVFERKFAHIKERAEFIASAIKEKAEANDIMDAVAFCDKSSEIYLAMKGHEGHFLQYFDRVNADNADFLWEVSKQEDYFYLCKCISESDSVRYEIKDAVRWFSGKQNVNLSEKSGDKCISFVRATQSNRAFESFAKFVPGVMAEYESDFARACESAANGEKDYAVIPVENSTDGRLNGFYRLMEKYGLSIVLATNVFSDDGENCTKFALLCKDFKIIEAAGELLFECLITFAEQSKLGNVIGAAGFFGADVKKIYSLPSYPAGRENSFDVIFRIDEADFAGFFCYLFLEYPRFTPIGIYTVTGDEE